MTRRAKTMTDRATAVARRAETPPTFAAGDVRVLVEALERLGYERAALLGAAKLHERELADPDGRIACAACDALFRAAQTRRPIGDFATRLAAVVPIGAYPLIDYLILTCDTVGDGLRQFARCFRHTTAATPIELHEHEDPIRVVFLGNSRFAAEFGIAITLFHLRDETDGALRVDEVSFTHQPEEPDQVTRMLGAPVRARATWNGFTLPVASWRLPLKRRDRALRALLERHLVGTETATTADPVDEARRVLQPLLARGETRIEHVARVLALSPRSLQRRLKERGVTYQQLLDSCRRESAERHLSERRYGIGEVAYLLGFSEPAAFHRAFKRWTGVTPREFRRTAGG
jgi:AraC-like DNA-binding protein